jgi:hypothetical protein
MAEETNQGQLLAKGEQARQQPRARESGDQRQGGFAEINNNDSQQSS